MLNFSPISIYSLNSLIRKDFPFLNVGNVVKVSNIFKFGAKDKSLVFEGIIISISNSNNINYSFKVLKEYNKIIVIKSFFYNDPSVTKIVVVKKPFKEKFRRAKLNYLERMLSKKK